ncbi:MAG: tail-specific protease [Kiritimatiellaeota bacterium]|nr:tail-specific protease [Kiritimatiellota bacterium]
MFEFDSSKRKPSIGNRANKLPVSMFSAFVFMVSLLHMPFSGAANELSPDEMGTIARISSNIIANKQFRKHPLDDEISEQLFTEYFDALDPGKYYLTKEDVAEFADNNRSLDDQLKLGDIRFAFAVYDRLVKRMKQYRDFVRKAIDGKTLDFTKNETFRFDRKKAERPTDAQLPELWRKKLKNDLLSLKILDRSMKMEKPKTKKEREQNKITRLWMKRPEERIKKRIDTYLNFLQKKRGIDRLEFYLNSLARIYDPHSAYMAPKSAEDFDISMRLSLVGIGAVLTTEDGYTKIVSIIKGGPANKDGRLASQDRIVAVAQEGKEPADIIDMPLGDVVQLIRGRKDTKVTLYVIKGNKGIQGVPTLITITRDKVKLKEQEAKGTIKTINAAGKKRKIGVIDLPSFYIDFKAAYEGKPDYKSVTRDVKKILERFNKEKVDGVIIDLRKNGGGSLSEAISLTGLFFSAGPVVQIQKASGGVPEIGSDYDQKSYYSGPLVLLVSRQSASAAEIFAAAIQDYGRGIIVGDEHTHGKGTVQTMFDLDNVMKYYGVKSKSGELKITVSKFYRINGGSTQMKGVTADIPFRDITDVMELGEKHLKHALPWDAISPANYAKQKDFSQCIKHLRLKSEQRRTGNPKFKRLDLMIERFKKSRGQKTISLNEEKRWRKYLDEKKMYEQQNRLLGLDEKNSGKKTKNDESDLFMGETMNIMLDLLNEGNARRTTVDVSPILNDPAFRRQ